jgi:hypothetical protein
MVIFNETECIVLYQWHEVMRGIKNYHNGLWYFPLTNKNNRDNVIIDTRHGMSGNIYHSSTLAETIQFLYQCMFLPIISTLCKAIYNDQLIGFPTITSTQVRKYLKSSTATVKGHMNWTRKGLRSTTKTQVKAKKEEVEDFNPQQMRTQK